jgi:hypothetical protein
MFEAEAAHVRAAGIQIGADQSGADDRLLAEALAPFGVSCRNQALEMARLYAVLYCFENEVREFVRETLREKVGEGWPDKIPAKIKEFAESRRAVPLCQDSCRTADVRASTVSDPLGGQVEQVMPVYSAAFKARVVKRLVGP